MTRPKPLTTSALIALHAERLVREADTNIYERGRKDMRDAVVEEIRRTLAFYEEPGRITREERGMVSGVLRGLIVNIDTAQGEARLWRMARIGAGLPDDRCDPREVDANGKWHISWAFNLPEPEPPTVGAPSGSRDST